LRKPREQWHVNRRGQLRDRQIDVDAPFQLGTRRVLESALRVAPEQRLEPTSIEPDRDHDEVVGDSLALVVVLDRDDDLSIARLDRRGPSGKGSEPA